MEARRASFLLRTLLSYNRSRFVQSGRPMSSVSSKLFHRLQASGATLMISLRGFLNLKSSLFHSKNWNASLITSSGGPWPSRVSMTSVYKKVYAMSEKTSRQKEQDRVATATTKITKDSPDNCKPFYHTRAEDFCW